MIPDIDLAGISAEFDTVDFATNPLIGRILLIGDDMEAAEAYIENANPLEKSDVSDCFYSGSLGAELKANLIFTAIDFELREKSLLEPHFGDQFSLHFFDTQTPVLQIKGHLINAYNDTHKASMYLAYRNILRVSQAARIGITPCLTAMHYLFGGSMLNLNLRESTARDGIIDVTFDWLLQDIQALVITPDTHSAPATGVTTTTIAFSQF